MRRKNLLKELGIQKQADTSCNALDIDTENVRQRVYAKLDFADTERKQTTMRSKKKRSEERRVGKESRSRWSPYH